MGVFWDWPDVDFSKVPDRAFGEPREVQEAQHIFARHALNEVSMRDVDEHFKGLYIARKSASPSLYYMWYPLARSVSLWGKMHWPVCRARYQDIDGLKVSLGERGFNGNVWGIV
jgi:hypothetical protein